jgi:predicted dehydrogenase
MGLVGLDTSHVEAFTRLLNDAGQEHHVPGGRVVAAFPGGSPDFELSHSRVEVFTRTLRDDYQVSIVESPKAVAEQVDAILLTAVDGRAHLSLFQTLAPYGKPVFIDKPLATSSADAYAISGLAQKYNVPLMSCSSLRYAQPLVDSLAMVEDIRGADCSGPMQIQPTQPGLFWYGIHCVDMLYAALGRGCKQVTATTNDEQDLIVGLWNDGRIGTIRGHRTGNRTFGALLHSSDRSVFVDAYAHTKPAYAGLLEHVMPMFKGEKPPIDFDETIEIVRFIEAANLSRVNGQTISL